jgi:Outer membrane protein beta-barrel domain
MKKFGCFLVGLLVLMMSVSAYGSDLTFYGGLQRQGKITLQSAGTAATSFVFNPKNFGVVGMRVGLGGIFGQEHTIAYSSSFIDSNSKALILNSNFIVRVPLIVVQPYATAGAGFIHTTGSGLSDVGTKFALNYGGGVKGKILGPVGGRLDVRGYAIPSIQSQTLNVLEVTLGVVFTF